MQNWNPEKGSHTESEELLCSGKAKEAEVKNRVKMQAEKRGPPKSPQPCMIARAALTPW
jgi:hypothetical protein